ncbi:MAG: hypothetical protein IJ298_01725 [Ruminococcus sp.]|nr:hypothetical protein [Ruminococcus sp.]
MFENVGRKIQVVSVVVFVIMLIASLAGAIVLWATLPRWLDGKFWIGLGTLVGGGVMAVFSSLMLQGYGIIVDANENKAEKPQTKKATATVSKSGLPEYNGGFFKDAEKKKEEERKPAGSPAQGEWKCTKCGRINQDYVGTCGCGQRKP